MSELGQHLKEIREQKQISLEDLQRTTKIQKRYLVAIEEGRFDTLPGLFYARAFVKTYAEAIGLDPEELFDQYKNELPNPQREAVVLPSRSERTKEVTPVPRTKKSPIIPVLITIVVVIIVIVLIWFLAQSKGEGEGNDQAVAPNEEENVEAEFGDPPNEEGEANEDNTDGEEGNDNEPDETNEVDETGETDPEPNTTLTFDRSEGNTSYFQLENGGLDEVRIEVIGNSYIDIKNGLGNTFYSGEPTAGEELLFDDLGDEEQVIFNFGASQNVNLFISDEQVEFPLDIIHQKIAITVAQ